MQDHKDGVTETKKMKKSTLFVIIAVALLVVVVVVFALLNSDGVAEKRKYQDDAEFLIKAGDQTYVVTMEEVLSLNPVEIEAIYKKSGKEPETRNYTGVPFADLVQLKSIDISSYTSVSFTAADGYASALPIEDAMNASDCYIIIAEAGEPLGKKEDGGSGPYRMILPNDQFSQRWCSFLMEVSFQ